MKRRYINLGNAGRNYSELEATQAGNTVILRIVLARDTEPDMTRTVWLSRRQVENLLEFAFGGKPEQEIDWRDV